MEKMAVRRLPTQERSRVKFEKVLDSAEELLVKHGIDYLTTPRIAEASGVTVGSIYQWFPNKESILSELYQRWLDVALDAYATFSADHLHVTSKTSFFTGLFRYYMIGGSEHDHRLSVELMNALRVNKGLEALDKMHEERLAKAAKADLIRLGILPKKARVSKEKAGRLMFYFSLQLTLMDMVSRSEAHDRDHFIDYGVEVIEGVVSKLG